MSTSTAHHRILLLFLLCLSLHACNAGRLGAVQKKSDNKFHIIKKSTKARGSDHSIPVVPMMKSFSSKPSLDHVEKGESTVLQTQSDSINTKEPKQTKTNDDLKAKSRKNTKGSASASGASVDHPITSRHDKSSFVSVSWCVPRNKRRVQKQPGFNLDYSPPKTHPPSHN
ncbi:unnamed protein product [Malus baccata var. baccata]